MSPELNGHVYRLNVFKFCANLQVERCRNFESGRALGPLANVQMESSAMPVQFLEYNDSDDIASEMPKARRSHVCRVTGTATALEDRDRRSWRHQNGAWRQCYVHMLISGPVWAPVRTREQIQMSLKRQIAMSWAAVRRNGSVNRRRLMARELARTG